MTHGLIQGCAVVLAAGMLTAAGCGERSPKGKTDVTAPAWLLTSMPKDARTVLELKPEAQEGETVAIRGRIGGRKHPMAAGSGLVLIVDASVPSCADDPEDNCPTPWDYCCERPELMTAATATVVLVDASDTPIEAELTSLGFSPLDEIIAVGVVGPRPSSEVLVIRARGIHRIGR
ncbi:MAG: hypothetical protein KF866_01655 [Phycisphaeraceae bacterium]|nr:hypothetical protein [Phycisphaeraceae bacterium]